MYSKSKEFLPMGTKAPRNRITREDAENCS